MGNVSNLACFARKEKAGEKKGKSVQGWRWKGTVKQRVVAGREREEMAGEYCTAGVILDNY